MKRLQEEVRQLREEWEKHERDKEAVKEAAAKCEAAEKEIVKVFFSFDINMNRFKSFLS